MKRVGGLWPSVVSFENLLAAARRAAAGKRRRPDVARFLLGLENEIVKLQRELESGDYRPGPYRRFELRDPKPRLISAASFRDRVVHHALTRVIEPVFERRFSAHSFACRVGFGTHRALAEARKAAFRHPCVLQCDVRKFFASIDHEILKAELARVLKCSRTLDLAGRIIDGSNPQEEVAAYFPGDNLFTPFERRRGLPLGNQTSQFFANVYLNPLDQFVERTLQPACYVRYVDDFVLFGPDKFQLRAAREAIEQFLGGLRLRIHPGKSRVYRVADGFTFLGWKILPDRARLNRGNVVRFRRRLRRLQKLYTAGRVSEAEIRPHVQAWIAHAGHGNTVQLRRQIFDAAAFRRRYTAERNAV